jgi:RNA polymerase sigma-70 factor (ECF subfamily)
VLHVLNDTDCGGNKVLAIYVFYSHKRGNVGDSGRIEAETMRGRDREAQRKREFEELTAPLLGALYRFATQKLRDAHQAEDLVQEVCLKAYQAFDHFERGTNYRAWLFRILSNTILDLQRQASKKPIEVNIDTGRSVFRLNIEAEHNRFLDPEQQLMAASLAHEVRTAIADLPPEGQTVVLLNFVEGFSYKEIAAILGCPIGTVMSRLYRARQVLRQRLERHLHGEDDAGPQLSRGEGAAVMPIDLLRLRSKKQAKSQEG